MTADGVQHDLANRWLLIAAVGLTVGGLLILTSVFFPRPDDPADYAGFLELMREHETRTKAVLLAVPLGLWIFALGTLALPRSAPTSSAMTVARIGGFAVLIGAAVATVQFSLGAAALAESEDGISDLSVSLWAGATYIRSFDMLVLWLGVALLGLGVVLDARFATWLAWPPLIIGIGRAGVSVVAILAGPSRGTAAGSGVTTGNTGIVRRSVSATRPPRSWNARDDDPDHQATPAVDL